MFFRRKKKEYTKEGITEDITNVNKMAISLFEETLLQENGEAEVREMLLSAVDETFKAVWGKYKRLLDDTEGGCI